MKAIYSAVVRGGAGGALAPPEFGSSVNPIPTKGGGADYAHHITASTPGFENLTTSLCSRGGGGRLCPPYRAVVSGGAGGTLAPPEFGSSVNPIPTRGGKLCPPHY